MSSALVLDKLGKQYSHVTAVKDVSLEVSDGEFIVFVGPSGCGKTTTLRMILGLERVSQGRVLIAGEDVTDVPTHRRKVGVVFQGYALFPHMSVAKNVEYGLSQQRPKLSKAQRLGRVREVLRQVHLEGFADRMPGELSGGQQQRVAIARALAPSPPLLLLDEPLSNLDAALRESMRIVLMLAGGPGATR
jgi:putative spermidine/putrescine transport system ATP-binding protein